MTTNFTLRPLLFLTCFIAISAILVSCKGEEKTSDKDKTVETSNSELSFSGKLNTAKLDESIANLPILIEYKKRIKASLELPIPILLLTEEQLQKPVFSKAQSIALKDKNFTKYTHHPKTKEPLRNEIMTVRPVLAADKTAFKTDVLAACTTENCFRVEMYNFFFNLSIVAFVDTTKEKVLALSTYSDAQPDISDFLTELAVQIAKNSELVKSELGGSQVAPTMAQIKTSLKNSRCERSHHLCVAPTFVVGDRALWAIVDLTEGNLVGTRWTELGSSGPPIEITERQLENEYVFREFCEQSQHLKRGDWQFDYQITSSDGLQLTNVKFKDKTVMKNVKLLDWHVSYSSRENFGYSDAIGCPLFSSAVVIAYDGPQVESIKEEKNEGFAFIQDFRQPPWPTPCNYRYEQRFEFYNDGRFRVAAADFGRGCGTDGTYRPVIRIDLETPSTTESNGEIFSQWNGSEWVNWDEEKWHLQQDNTHYTQDGYLFKFTNTKNEGYYIEPNRGQFNDGSKGDFAYTYVTVNHEDKDEAKSDMPTIGLCCNTTHEQGPEQFMEPAESLQQKNLVMWYVPQIKNEGKKGEEYCWADTRVEQGIPKVKVWPCYAGPMFIPTNN